MKCIYCGCTESKVLDSRNSEEANSIRRRRECINCGRRFTTYETIEMIPVTVIKKDGSKHSFDNEILKQSIVIASKNNAITESQIENISKEIEKKAQSMPNQEISTKKIGEMVCNFLKNLDEMSYIKYMTIYKDFDGVDSLKDFIDNI